MNVSKDVLQALAVTAELTGTLLTPAGARMMAQDLSPYPERQVLAALSRCRKELKGRMTVADVVARLEDGRPGPDEAWSMMPIDEATTVAWTEEMSGAWAVALPLLVEGDRIAARMAFLESYRARVQKARDAATTVRWSLSLGHDVRARAPAIEQAIRLGRIQPEHAARIGYTPEAQGIAPAIAHATEATLKRLTAKGPK